MSDFQHIPNEMTLALKQIAQKNLNLNIQPGVDFIPVTSPCLDTTDILSAIDVLLSGWLVGGGSQPKFEESLSEFIGSKCTFLVNSGSSANLLAFAALCSPSLGERALRPGDEVITVAAGFPTTLNPILQYGCIPVFIDVDIETGNAKVDDLKAALSTKTKAIVLAHTLGNPFDLEAITAFTKEHDLWLIEDNCDALGATYNGQLTGSFGDLATLSFYPAHHITTGEGGAVLVNNPRLKRIVECLRNWGRDCWCQPGQDNACGQRFAQSHGNLPVGYDHKYVYSEIGFNLKMTDIQAILGLSQLKKIEQFRKKRVENHRHWSKRLSDFTDFFYLPKATSNSAPSWFGFLLTIKHSKIQRRDLIAHLHECKIGTRHLFGGNLIKQPAYREMKFRAVNDLINTDVLLRDALWMGVWPGLGSSHIDYMADCIGDFLKSRSII